VAPGASGGRPKRSKAGYEERLETLRRYVPGIDRLNDWLHLSRARRELAPHYVLDALVLSVNAWLGSRYGIERFPAEGGELDRYGPRMEMVTAPWAVLVEVVG
jgi:predicted RNase H-like nuclease